jgi:hypothetical protein
MVTVAQALVGASELQGHAVVQIACGIGHCIALACKLDLYFSLVWGVSWVLMLVLQPTELY